MRELRKGSVDAGLGAPRPEDRRRDDSKRTTIRRVTFSSEATRGDVIVFADEDLKAFPGFALGSFGLGANVDGESVTGSVPHRPRP
jgi:hypothetical protein